MEEYGGLEGRPSSSFAPYGDAFGVGVEYIVRGEDCGVMDEVAYARED